MRFKKSDFWLLIFALFLVLLAYFIFHEYSSNPLVYGAQIEIVSIEAEDYREGGEGVAYHDETENNTGNTDYRTEEAVDLWDVGTGIKVGSVKTGEFLTYDIDLPRSGTYVFRFYLSTPNESATLDLFIDGLKIGSITAPKTGDYNTFEPVEKKAFIKAPGPGILKVLFTGDSVDFDKFEIEFTGAGISVDGLQPVDYVTYFGTTDEKIKIEWDHNEPKPELYEVELFNFERQETISLENGKTAENFINVTLPYSGHFVARIRACEGTLCSDWTETTDKNNALVNGEKKGFWLYGYIAPAGGIIIKTREQEEN